MWKTQPEFAPVKWGKEEEKASKILGTLCSDFEESVFHNSPVSRIRPFFLPSVPTHTHTHTHTHLSGKR